MNQNVELKLNFISAQERETRMFSERVLLILYYLSPGELKWNVLSTKNRLVQPIIRHDGNDRACQWGKCSVFVVCKGTQRDGFTSIIEYQIIPSR